MEGIEVAVDPEAINRYLAEQIMGAALGARIKEAVDDAIKSLSKYGSDPLKDAVISEVQQGIRELVRKEYKERIREAVKAKLTDDEIDKLVNSFVIRLTLDR